MMTGLRYSTVANVATLFIFCSSAVADDTVQPVDAVRSAVQRGRDLVATAGTNWTKNRKCFACHHQTLPLLTSVETERYGFPADLDWRAAQVKHTRDHFADRLDELRAGEHIGGGSSTAGCGLWALKLAGYPADDVTTATVEYLLKLQGVVRLKDRDSAKPPQLKDGAWPTSCRRPPLQGSDVATTVLALITMEHYATEEQRPRLAAARVTADKWLAETPLASQDDRAWRLWGLSQLGGDAAVIKATRDAIFAAQRDDGGWSETSDRPSDAYSTGETLFILIRSQTPATEPAVLRARDYLLKTQHADGSWLVETHVKPVQTFFENGDPHGKHQFLSTAATAWSTAALTQLLPLQPIEQLVLQPE